MSRVSLNYISCVSSAICMCAISIGLLFCPSQVQARNLQIMLVPESATTQLHLQATAVGTLPDAYSSLEKGLTLSLSRSASILIDKQSALTSCEGYLCGEQDMSTLMQKVSLQAPKISFLVLYSFDDKHTPTLSVRLLDPISFRVIFSDDLSLIEEVSSANLVSLGRDMGKIVVANLVGLESQSEYSLVFDGFLLEELSGLSTWLLANTGNSKLVLTKSSVNYQLFDKYFATNTSQYSLKTPLNASQVKQTLNKFFERKALNTIVVFAHANTQNSRFNIVRQGNPYARSLIATFSIVFGALLLIAWLVRRHTLNVRLTHYSELKNTEMCLLIYTKASFIIFGLQNKWKAQAQYWQQCLKESNELAKQATLYFEDRDVHNAKLFSLKSNQLNAGNLQSKKLLKDIEALEVNAKTLEDNEQWIKDQFSSAMNNYRQKEIIKALHCLFQANTVAKQEPSFASQSHAINKLIKQINQEYSTKIQALVLNSSSSKHRLVLCQNEIIHLGRLANINNSGWISPQDNIFYINHELVSKAGQQCYIKRQQGVFMLVDANSKNGTYLNNIQLKPLQPSKINHLDVIQLGASTPSLSARYKVNLQANESILELSLDMQSMPMLSNHDLNKFWPDNALAQRSRLMCMHHECCIMLNETTNEVFVCELNELASVNQGSGEQEIDNTNYKGNTSQLVRPLVIVRLGNNASIRPLASAIATNGLTIDSIPLLGEVPLIFPCTLKYANISIQLADYDRKNISGSYSSSITSATIVGTP